MSDHRQIKKPKKVCVFCSRYVQYGEEDAHQKQNDKDYEEEYVEEGAQPAADTVNDDQIYCFCRRPSTQEMICCDNEDCAIKWFHLRCVGLDTIPDGTWYCPNCRAIMESKNATYVCLLNKESRVN